MSMYRKSRLTILWLFIAFLIVFTFFIFAPQKALSSFFYESSKSLSNANKKLIQLNDPSKAKIIKNNSKKIIRRIPISSEPFVHIAYADYLINPNEFNTSLIAVAKNRSPRSRVVIKTLLSDAITKDNKFNIALEASTLFHLEKKDRDKYFAMLANVYSSPSGGQVINPYLRNDITWGPRLLFHFISSLQKEDIEKLSSSIEVFLSRNLTQLKSIETIETINSEIISKFVNRLIDIEAPNKALEFWLKSFSFEHFDYKTSLGVLNPKFLAWNATPPFNWFLVNNKAVLTEEKFNGGVFVRYRGRKEQLIGRQLIQWKNTTSIQLHIDSVYQHDENKGSFFIELQCLNSTNLISRFDLVNSEKEGEIKVHKLVIAPQSCQYAYLNIKAKPGQYASPISMEINYLNLDFKL